MKWAIGNGQRSHLRSWLILLLVVVFSSEEQADVGLCDGRADAETGKLRMGVGGSQRGGLWGGGSGDRRGLEGRLHEKGQGVSEVEKQVGRSHPQPWKAVVREWDVGFGGFRGGALPDGDRGRGVTVRMGDSLRWSPAMCT